MIGTGIHHQIEGATIALRTSYVSKYSTGIHLDALDTFNGHDYLTSRLRNLKQLRRKMTHTVGYGHDNVKAPALADLIAQW
ncbi:hypothetical protein KCP78_05235 [Salmonella enterica subsp. enterica]|nr:hypothetical protein KCP78_05235 [Salmonella enterica subsp. enterica]